MRCPYCRSRHVIPDITVRWSQLRGRLRPVRGNFCTGCGRPFSEVPNSDLTLLSVRVEEVSSCLYSLQASGDVVIVRHRTGTSEVLF